MTSISVSTNDDDDHPEEEEEEEEKEKKEDELWEYIFGFGSIINTTTHAPWLSSSSSSSSEEQQTQTQTKSSLPGQRAFVKASWGYRRGWNFRSNTGFTALGIVRATTTTNEEEPREINGVVFRVTREMLSDFDRREVGYDRVELPLDQLVFNTTTSTTPNSNSSSKEMQLRIKPHQKVWVYVPQQTLLADEDHPILQSYVDTVCQGCLEWGGEDMCREFVATTFDWSPYFLNDTPSSRRPWLFRKEYATIDTILQEFASRTHLEDRRHPEEFASAFLIKLLRGSWGVPPRNRVFTGRDAELSQIHALLLAQRWDHHHATGNNNSSNINQVTTAVAKVEVAGMGGVGKSQLVTEYCYRYFPSYYGLVIWLSAQSAESVAAGYRQLMADTCGTTNNTASSNGTNNKNDFKDTDEVVGEVKTRLFRSKVPWLLVFDNLEDPSLLEKFVPRGGGAGTGHVLVTTRLVDTIDFGDQTVILGCFQPEESLALLCRATQTICSERDKDAARELAERLGHLPLALGMAAAYMRRCDVNCEEYLRRYIMSPNAAHMGGVSASLSLSLNAIRQENPAAWEALRLLAWLGPDQITKKLLRSLMLAKQTYDLLDNKEGSAAGARSNGLGPSPWLAASPTSFYAAAASLALLSLVTVDRTHTTRGRVVGSAVLLAASTALAMQVRVQHRIARPPTVSAPVRRDSHHLDVFEQTDRIWNILKSFSILVVKEGQGSMHRLLAQALRLSQEHRDSSHNLKICLATIQKMWMFKPERIETWHDSTNVLEHAKAVLLHAVDRNDGLTLDMATLSREVGVFSAMALNRFKEAQLSIELSLKILDSIPQLRGRPTTEQSLAYAATLHELGRVFRYQGQFQLSEDALRKALEIRNRLARTDKDVTYGIAATQYELGVLEVKKHNLESAASFLEQALELRRTLERESPNEDTEADCASTLHQLAAVHVAEKPPSLDVAESLLNEALSLSMQIGQRAATLKQLARVAIRRGDFDNAERSLAQALELYVELYGENSLHINVAAVKFQQGALAFQRDQLEQAWLDFSECLRARRHVYSYSQGNHLEVSSVLYELGCVALTQHRVSKAAEMLTAEREILDQLYEESSSQRERIFQARLTNLTWLRKCAKAQGDEEKVRQLNAERSCLKHKVKEADDAASRTCSRTHQPRSEILLQQEALRCRLVARQFALATTSDPEQKQQQTWKAKKDLEQALMKLARDVDRCTTSSSHQSSSPNNNNNALDDAILHFHCMVTKSLGNSATQSSSIIFDACDDLRDAFRDHGLQVNDIVQGKKNKCLISPNKRRSKR